MNTRSYGRRGAAIERIMCIVVAVLGLWIGRPLQAGICGPDSGDCCSAHDTPGCNEPACCLQVCELDPFCCDGFWSDLCVATASAWCPICGGCSEDIHCDDGDPCTADMCVLREGCFNTPDDVNPPVILCPPDAMIGCDDSTDPEFTGLATATDDCTDVPVVGFGDSVEGICPPQATILRTWTAIDNAGNNSSCDQLIVQCDPPVITTQPQSRAVCEGTPLLLSADIAGGDPPLIIEWYHNGELVPGSAEPILSIDAVTADDAGNYQLVVTDACATVTSHFARVFVYGENELPPPIVLPQRAPERWQSEDFQWSGDTTPYNKIDDQIDAGGPGPFDIVVNFRVETGPDQIAAVSAVGTVQHVSAYVTTIYAGGVTAADVQVLATRADVAFIELQVDPVFYLDIAKQASKVSAGFYTPDTVADQFPQLDGSGVNIVIMDSGVDDPGGAGVTHQGLPAASFFYDAVTATFTNPDDINGHGTHVAGIALGRGIGSVSPGVAPGAGLIDVRIAGMSATSLALQHVIQNRFAWNVGVINMSFGYESVIPSSDGQDSFSQQVDVAVGAGLVVFCAAGNHGPTNVGLPPPAAASEAITIANAEDHSTPDRADDTLRSSSSRGPRADDMDGNCMDELKPELAAHGTSIFSTQHDSSTGGENRTGTSMATPHVAGVAALLLQADPQLTPGAIRQILIATAEQRGTPSASGCDPDWNDGWGWGLIDAHAAVSSASGSGPPSTPQSTDLGFATFTGYVYANTRIETINPPQVNVPNQIRALVENFGPTDAVNANVKFKIDYISATSGSFYDVGTVTVPLIPSGTQQYVSINWTPQHIGHQCLKAAIDYAPDTNSANNNAQRNITVAQSPVYFRVENLMTPEPIEIEFVTAFENPDSEWGVQFTPPSVILAGGEFAIIEALPLPPFGAPDGEQETIYVSSMHDGCLLGGVAIIATMKDCNKNGIDDWIDLQNGDLTDKNGDGIPDECACPADLNGDLMVNAADLALVLGAWGPCPGCTADLTGDDVVNAADLALVLGSWGPCK